MPFEPFKFGDNTHILEAQARIRAREVAAVRATSPALVGMDILRAAVLAHALAYRDILSAAGLSAEAKAGAARAAQGARSRYIK